MAKQVESVRTAALCRQRDGAALAQEVQQMRDKMSEHLLSSKGSESAGFDLKQGPGGIVDIEFMVQYAVLAWCHRVPELARWTDNIRILDTLGREGLFAQDKCDALREAYIAYRSAAHQLSLQQQAGTVPAEQFVDQRSAVTAAWQTLFTPS